MSTEKTQRRIAEKNASMQMRRSYFGIFGTALFLILFLFFSSILYLTFGKAFQNAEGKVLTRENEEELLTQMESDSSDISFETVMNYDWLFESGDAASSNAYVENGAHNQNAFYFTVTLAGPDQTVLYISPTLAVGEVLDSIKLNTVLPAGVYDAALIYYLLDEAGNTVDAVEMGLTITIEH